MLWDAFIGRVNSGELLKQKGMLLAQLIINTAKGFHDLAESSAARNFSIFEKQYSESEHAALYAAKSLTLTDRYLDDESSRALTGECLKGLMSSLDAREPTRELSNYFENRFYLLADLVVWDQQEKVSGWTPDTTDSFQAQCRILGLQRNALLITLSDSLVMRNLQRWELHRLVTGEG